MKSVLTLLGSVSELVWEVLPIYRRGCLVLGKTLLYEASVRLVLGGVRHGHQVLVCVASVVVHGSWFCVRSYDL